MKQIYSINRRSFIGDISKVSLLGVFPLNQMIFGEQKSAEVKEEENENTFLCEPYLQHMRPDGVTIMWIVSQNSFSWVEVKAPGQEPQKVFNVHYGLIDANTRLAKIRIENLKPGTRYQYQVFSKTIKLFEPYKVEYGQTIQKGPFHFSTPAIEADQISFVVLNDTHENPDNITELLGKFTNPNDYDFVIFNGDTFHWNDGEERIVNALLTPVGKVFSPQRPFLMVQGNHEGRGNYARQFFQYFDYPNNQCYHAFTSGPVRLIVLDSGEDKEDSHEEYSGLVSFDAYREEQARWLAEEIRSTEFEKAVFRIVLIHIPVFHSGDWHGTIHCRKLFNPLFNEGKIDLAISGHRHRYGIFEADPQTHNYPIIIGGGSGTANQRGGQRTVIKINANSEVLSLEMLADNGLVGSYEIHK